MKIYQVKYNQNHYAYYKSAEQNKIEETTKLYLTYTDARDDINPMTGFEYTKLRDSLIKFYKTK
jgi:hypothetical protein